MGTQRNKNRHTESKTDAEKKGQIEREMEKFTDRGRVGETEIYKLRVVQTDEM